MGKSLTSLRNDPVNKGKKYITLTKTADLTSISAIQRQLKKIYADTKMIEFEGENLEQVDLAFIQMVLSLRQSARRDKKHIINSLKLTEEQQQLINRAGFKSNLKV